MFALRALTPAGYMLAPTAEPGRFVTVTLCSLHGSVQAVLDRQTGQLLPDAGHAPAPGEKQADGGPCVFAASAPLAPPAQTATFIATAPVSINAPTLQVQYAIPGRGLAAPPPWSTGPPRTI